MFITRECDYAVRVVRALMGVKKLSVSEICEKEGITSAFAYKILKKLQQAGIVCGYRGVKGGYSLAKEPKDLTLLMIYRAMDSKMLLIDCLEGEYLCSRNKEWPAMCTIHHELMEIQKEVFALLKRKSMEELLPQEK